MDVMYCLNDRLRNYIENLPDKADITEIRMRAGAPVRLTAKGRTETVPHIVVSQKEIEDIMFAVCSKSINVYEDDIAQGFITLDSGHRIGIAGEYCFSTESGKYLLKKVTSLNVRLPKDSGYFCGQEKLFELNPVSTLVIGAPHSGKTTFLKVYVRKLSDNYRVVVCDERGELSASEVDCDVIKGVKKSDAVIMATRTLNPQFIVCDETAGMEETKQILSAVNTGVDFICSAHGNSLENIKKRPDISVLLDHGVFSRVIKLVQKDGFFALEEISDV